MVEDTAVRSAPAAPSSTNEPPAKHLSSKQQWTFSSDDSDIRLALRQEGLRGREVPAFLHAAAGQGLLSEVRENEYTFTHSLLQDTSAPLTDPTSPPLAG